MGQTYPVGVAGESFYQAAIGCCAVGDSVQILWESDNPYGGDALVCIARGRRIGHIPAENWVMSAVHDDGLACEAVIKGFNRNGRFTGVVLDVSTVSGPIAQFSYDNNDEPLPRGCLSWFV